MVIERADISVIPGRKSSSRAPWSAGARCSQAHRVAPRCRCYAASRDRHATTCVFEWNSIADTRHLPKRGLSNVQDIAGPFFSERPATEHFQPVHLPVGRVYHASHRDRQMPALPIHRLRHHLSGGLLSR